MILTNVDKNHGAIVRIVDDSNETVIEEQETHEKNTETRHFFNDALQHKIPFIEARHILILFFCNSTSKTVYF